LKPFSPDHRYDDMADEIDHSFDYTTYALELIPITLCDVDLPDELDIDLNLSDEWVICLCCGHSVHSCGC